MYSAHLIIGFLYSRNKNYSTQVVPFSKINTVQSPVTDIKYFVAEKPGSGNTANIGTIASNNIQDFIDENGPFAMLGDKAFEDYWRNYPTPSERANGNVKYSNLETYIAWKKKTDLKQGVFLEKKYKEYLSQN